MKMNFFLSPNKSKRKVEEAGKAERLSSSDKLFQSFQGRGGGVSLSKAPKSRLKGHQFETVRPKPDISGLSNDDSAGVDDMSSTPSEHLSARWDTRESLTPRKPDRGDGMNKPQDCVPSRAQRRTDVPIPALRSSDLPYATTVMDRLIESRRWGSSSTEGNAEDDMERQPSMRSVLATETLASQQELSHSALVARIPM